MADAFQSFDESTLGAFIESPLGMRTGDLPRGGVWATHRDDIYRLSSTDFTVLDEAVSTLGNVWGIGGDNSVVWGGVDSGSDEFIQQYSPVDLSPVIGNRTVDLDVAPGFGCGGNADGIFFCAFSGEGLIYNPDFSINFFSSLTTDIGATNPSGMGGGGAGLTQRILLTDTDDDTVRDIYPDRHPSSYGWYIVRQIEAPGSSGGCEGCGGDGQVCYVSNVHDDEIWVYDHRLHYVSGPHPWVGDGSPFGIGGGRL